MLWHLLWNHHWCLANQGYGSKRKLTGGCQENDTLSGKTCFTEKSRGGPGTSKTLTKPVASQTPELLSSRNLYIPVSRNRSLFNTVKMEFRSVYTEFLHISSIVVVSGSWHKPFSLRNHEQLGAGSPPNQRSYEKDRPFLMVISCIPGCFTNGSTATIVHSKCYIESSSFCSWL